MEYTAAMTLHLFAWSIRKHDAITYAVVGVAVMVFAAVVLFAAYKFMSRGP